MSLLGNKNSRHHYTLITQCTCFCDLLFVRHVFNPIPVPLTTQVLCAILTRSNQTFSIALSVNMAFYQSGFYPKQTFCSFFSFSPCKLTHISSVICNSNIYRTCIDTPHCFIILELFHYTVVHSVQQIRKMYTNKTKVPPLSKHFTDNKENAGCGCIIRHLQYLGFSE